VTGKGVQVSTQEDGGVIIATTVFILKFAPVAEGKAVFREALAMKVTLDGDKAAITVAFNYTGKPGDPPTFQGVRMFRHEVPVGKGPTHVGWEGKEGRETVVMGGKKYTYFPAEADRRENGTLSVSAVADGKVRLTGVYHAFGTLFVVDETVKPDVGILLEAGGDK
jgi:hypothetical protein